MINDYNINKMKYLKDVSRMTIDVESVKLIELIELTELTDSIRLNCFD